MGINRTETFTFVTLPPNAQELMALPEASLDSPYKTTALTMLALMQYEKSPDTCYAMLDALRGPDPISPYAKSFIKEHLDGKFYKVKSFFAGATVANSYIPSTPYTIAVSAPLLLPGGELGHHVSAQCRRGLPLDGICVHLSYRGR